MNKGLKKGLLLLVFSAAACSSSTELAKQTFVVELGADVYANPNLYLKDTTGTDAAGMEVVCLGEGVQVVDNRFVSAGHDYLVSGEYDCLLKNGQEELPFVIKVKDTLPPSCKEQPEKVETTIGIMPDWVSVFEASDLSGVSWSAPASAVEERGERDVDVTLSDRFGNSVVKTVHLVVR